MINAEKGTHFATIVVGATVLDLAIPAGMVPVRATLTLETAQIRYRYDGVLDPTATEGHVMDAGDAFTLEGVDNIRNFRMLRTGSTSGVLSRTLEAL